MKSEPARALELHKDTAALILAKPLRRWEKYAAAFSSMGPLRFARLEAAPLVDFLINYLRRGDQLWRDLYLGERLKQLDWPADSLEQAASRCRAVLAADRDELSELLKPHRKASDADAIYSCLDGLMKLASAPSKKVVRALMVGDTLLLQIFGFLSASLLEDGIKLRPLFLTDKNPVELHKSIQALRDREFDLVCFSPYSYQFNSSLARTVWLRTVLAGGRDLEETVGRAHQQTESILNLLTDSFDCTIMLHYTANLRTYVPGSWLAYFKTIATRRRRVLAATHANELLERSVAENNRASRPIITLDERALVAQYGERRLARKIYNSCSQHPTFLAMELARLYRNVITSV